MSKLIKRGKIALVVSLTISTVVWSIGLAAFTPTVFAASAGDLIKQEGSASVYYLGSDSKRYVFPNKSTFDAWYGSDATVTTVSSDVLLGYELGGNAVSRAGRLMQVVTNDTPWMVADAKVYAVSNSGAIQHIDSATTAVALFGSDWETKIIAVPEQLFSNYTAGTQLTSSSTLPDGFLVTDGTDTYVIEDGAKRAVSAEGFTANKYKESDKITLTDLSAYTDGSAVSSAESGLFNIAGGAVVTTTPGSGVTVALAADTAASTTVLADSTDGDGGQALVDTITLNFTAASDGDATVSTLKFKRSGVPSADTDFSDFYLYDGSTKLAGYTSISDGILTFSKSAGLFTVAAGTTKAITLKIDVDDDVAASRSFKFGLVDSTYVVAGTSTISGTFPIYGNTFSTATVSDLGKLTLAHSNYSATVDAGETEFELWKVSMAAADQNVEVKYIKFTNVGTIAAGDLQNIKLVGDDGVTYGETHDELGADGTVAFDLSAVPIAITKGNTEYYSIKGDIVGGTNRTFKFSVQNMDDMIIEDMNYEVYIKPNQEDSWTIIESAANSSISTGSLTVTRNLASPSGNVPLDGTNVTVGKFDFAAVGENIKISSLPIDVTNSTQTDAADDGLYELKLIVDGTQIGSTTHVTTNAGADTTFTFGNNFIIPAGETKTLEITATIKDGGADSFTATDVFYVQLVTGSGNWQGVTSLTTGATGSSDGYSLTVVANTLSAAANASVANASSSIPSGVPGSVGVKVGSFVITAGAAEPVNVSAFYVTDNNSSFGDFQNLKLKKADGTQIGNTKPTVATGTTYTFNPSPQISLSASESVVVNVYADFKSSASGATTYANAVEIAQVNGTGVDTNTSANYTIVTNGQTVYIASGGSLTITLDGSTPSSAQLVTGSTGNHIATFRIEETSGAEGVNITKIILNNTTAADNTLTNWAIYDGSTGVQIGETVPVSASGVTTFNGLNWNIPAGGVKTFKVEVGVADYSSAVENTSNFAYLASGNGNAFEATGEASGSLTITVGTSDVNANSMKVYRTVLTVNKKTTSNSGGSYGASQEVAKLGFLANANYDAKLQAATVNAVADNTNWQTDIGAAAVIDEATYTIDGAGIEVLEDTAATADDSVFYAGAAGAGLSLDLSGYKYAGFWIMSDTAEAASDVEFCMVAGQATPTSAHCSAAAAGTVSGGTTLGRLPALTANIWDFVEVDISGVTRTDIDAYGINFVTGLALNQQVYIDNIKFYNNSINLDISGNLGTATTSDGLAFYFKDASNVTKMTGYLDNANSTSAGTVIFIPAATELALSSSEQIYSVVTNTSTLMATDDTADQSLIVNIDLGDASTAGDMRWYDSAITATSPITWVSGTEDPITYSYTY
jgi:hypothetical protein